MKRGPRRIALAWIYMGNHPADRLETIAGGDAAGVKLIAVGNREVRRAAELYGFSRPDLATRTLDAVALDSIWGALGAEAEALVLWIDDGKRVSPGFVREMAAPVLADRHLHYWDGNALALSQRTGETLSFGDMLLRDDDLLTLLSDIVDHGSRLGSPRMRLLFSPAERFSTMSMEPLGLAS